MYLSYNHFGRKVNRQNSCTRVRNIYVIGMWTYLWQNFLIDGKIRSYLADKISSVYKNLSCEALIEIGPGKGSITKLIHGISENFFVIEKDASLKATLLEMINDKWEMRNYLEWDVLEVDVEKILKEKNLDSKKTLVVGNLPYYITSPILRKFFWNWNQKFSGWIFMVQDEVGQKLRSDAKKKSYLRWLLNYAYTVTYLKGVPAKCFKPVPKVKSCLIQLTMNDEQWIIQWDSLIQFLDMFAPFSRKTLGAIQTMINKKSDCTFIIPPALQKKRLEELSFEELAEII